MNFTYFQFLFATTIKKRPVWITCLLMLLTCTMFIIVLPAVAKFNTLQVWANTTMMVCQSFLALIMALFTAVLGIHIFQDGNAEGTELIVISKPIKRYKIILTKYLVFGLFCLLANLLVVIITIFTAFLPTSEKKFYWGLVISMFIGNCITMMIYGALSIIMTVKLAKTGVIVVNVVVALILLIYQMLGMLVFTTPAKSLVRHGVVAPTYIVQNRQEDGSYTEEEVVKFGLTDLNPTLTKDKRFSGYSWNDVKEYWTDVVLEKDPTPIINATDIAGQLALSYLTTGIDKYSYRQASRNFALSKQYNYKLTKPASPEILPSTGSDTRSLPFVYVGLNASETALFGQTYYYPSYFGFSGIAPVSGKRFQGFTDKIPVGVYMPAKADVISENIFFEQEDWNKYMRNFEIIYKNVFDHKHYDDLISKVTTVDKNNAYLLNTGWALNNETLRRYYQLIWACLTGRAATDSKYFGKDKSQFVDEQGNPWTLNTFDIKNNSDLNRRFIQFKYACCMFVLKDQHELFNKGIKFGKVTTKETETIYNNALDNLRAENGLYAVLGAKHKQDPSNLYNFYMVNDGYIYPYVEPGTQVPDFNLMSASYNILKETADVTLDELANSAIGNYVRTSAIFDKCCYEYEQYLFSSIDSDTDNRSAEEVGRIYVVQDNWYSYWDTINPFAALCKGQNMTYFYYETKPRANYWVYAVIWATIAMTLYAISFVMYYKYDFH